MSDIDRLDMDDKGLIDKADGYLCYFSDYEKLQQQVTETEQALSDSKAMEGRLRDVLTFVYDLLEESRSHKTKQYDYLIRLESGIRKAKQALTQGETEERSSKP